MMQTQGAIGNLLNRYRSVLKKCISFNMFSVLLSLALSFALLGGTAQAALNVDEGTDARLHPEGGIPCLKTLLSYFP